MTRRHLRPWSWRATRALLPWLIVLVLGGALALWARHDFDVARGREKITWHSPHAIWLIAAGLFAGLVAFHLHRRRAAAMAFSQTELVRRVGPLAWLSDLPGALRVVALLALAVALCRPETYRTIRHQIDTVDIMIVVDMSKSMEETDLPRDRLDAAQRVIRRFLRRSTHDRVGLVIFGQQAMLQCPLTLDTKVVEQIVTDLAIGDVPELGTAIGDGLGLALSQLRDDRREDGEPAAAPDAAAPAVPAAKQHKDRVVILLSDGDSNAALRFEPDEAAQVARQMGVKVYTILVGKEDTGL
ncbi:MAG TPA: VWA domain-containing protein, partial [Kofleriaceae bacterium]